MFRYLFLITISITGLANAQELKLASDAWPPFTDVDDKIHYAQDIVLEALKRSGQKAAVEIIDFGDVNNLWNNGSPIHVCHILPEGVSRILSILILEVHKITILA